VTVDVTMDEVTRKTGPLPQAFGNLVAGDWTTPDGETLSALSFAAQGLHTIEDALQPASHGTPRPE
jgi:hypothetical protein